MTAQKRDILFYKGEIYYLATEPLKQYLQNRSDIKFYSPSTDCWRGYVGEWLIFKNLLYLFRLTVYTPGDKTKDLNYLFPSQKYVFANWFSGEIRIPYGEMLKYVHSGYESIYEKDLILKFNKGMLTEEVVIDNREEFEKREIENEIQRESKVKQKKKKTFWNRLFGK